MRNIKIFQIFYSSETKKSLDPGFLPLDNMKNARADWREYWPIRNYLMNNLLDDDCLYGFFSPKFNAKTGLSANDCYEFIKGHSNDIDVFSFSPFFDLGAFYQNSFLQAISQHPDSGIAMEGGVKIIAPSCNISELVMHSGNNIYCNFFIATPSFWRAWLEKCELIWAECEANASVVAKGLNTVADTHDSTALIKTFLIERVASLMIATNHSWSVKAFNPFVLPLSHALIQHETPALIQMDALKIAYASQNRVEYLNFFKHFQNLVIENLS